MQETMSHRCSVFREEKCLEDAFAAIQRLKKRFRSIRIEDKGKTFNQEIIEAIELGFMLELSEAIIVSAIAREESRGAHYREDFAARDDAKFLKHTLVSKLGSHYPSISYKPVVITRFEPKPRVY
jgi:succinate dehydrogenase / fumarate reductase flavoprotein subunit